MVCMKVAFVAIAIYQVPDLAFHFQYRVGCFGVWRFFCATMTKPPVYKSENYFTFKTNKQKKTWGKYLINSVNLVNTYILLFLSHILSKQQEML